MSRLLHRRVKLVRPFVPSILWHVSRAEASSAAVQNQAIVLHNAKLPPLLDADRRRLHRM
jgi:hypothetical protein